MEIGTVIYFLIIAFAAVLVVKAIKELLSFFAVILIVVLGASGMYIFNGSSNKNVKEVLGETQEQAAEKPRPKPYDTLFHTVGTSKMQGSNGDLDRSGSIEMKQSEPLFLEKEVLRPVAPVKLPSNPNYNLEERINKVTQFKVPSKTIAGAYASTFKEAKEKAAELRRQGFDHLFIIRLPDYEVEGAEGWPYAITITGPLSKQESIDEAIDHFYYLAELGNHISEQLDVLYLYRR